MNRSQTQNQLTLAPIRQVTGEVTLPGSKSLSNRALLLSALAEGTTRLKNLLRSDDTERMLAALRQLGTGIELSADWQSGEVLGTLEYLTHRMSLTFSSETPELPFVR